VFPVLDPLDEVNIYTPVNWEILRQYLDQYHDARFVIEGFKEGFSLGVKDKPLLKPYTKLLPIKASLREKVKDEVQKGRIIGPFTAPPMRDLMISPISTIPKPNSTKVRMIFNLSHPPGFSVNDNVKDSVRSVSYCSVSDVARWLLHNDHTKEMYLAKADLTDAYRMVPIKKSEWHLLGMRVGEHLYIDRCLPMGASSSCHIFQRISDALAWIVVNKGPVECCVFNYLDDFLFIASGQERCNQVLSYFSRACDKTGIALSPQKTIKACQKLVFLGINVDAKNQCLSVPSEKVEQTLNQLQKFLTTPKPKVHLWQKILGKLTYLTYVVAAGRPFLGSVYGSLKGILSQDRHRRRHINKEAREDLGVWMTFLKELPPERQFRMLEAAPEDFSIYTDASTSGGFGGIFGNAWFAGSWPAGHWQTRSIAFLELYPVYAALHTWTETFRDSTVAIYSDNQAVVDVLHKLYTKDKLLRQLLKPCTLTCLKNNIRISAYHIPGVENVGPDLLSRGKINEFLEKFPEASRSPTNIPGAHAPENLNIEGTVKDVET
jgi:hypothetical protein